MINLPKTTEYNKRIPKYKILENTDASPAIKKTFSDQVRTIYWRNKIATSTVNLATGSAVTEIQVFEIFLKNRVLAERILRLIDKAIPYHILYLLEYQGMYQAWIAHKEAINPEKKFIKINTYYHTDWMSSDSLNLGLEGLNLDDAYEGFVRQIAGDLLDAKNSGESLKESVDRSEQRKQLQKEIDKLSAKISKEKQLNRQMEMNDVRKQLQKKLNQLL
jgi:hypothetical protein